MKCPFCNNSETQVKDSRPTEDGAAIRRRRLCPACGSRFTSFERVQLRDLTVIKKDGKRAVEVGLDSPLSENPHPWMVGATKEFRVGYEQNTEHISFDIKY